MFTHREWILSAFEGEVEESAPILARKYPVRICDHLLK
jgi:hypothetical protein